MQTRATHRDKILVKTNWVGSIGSTRVPLKYDLGFESYGIDRENQRWESFTL